MLYSDSPWALTSIAQRQFWPHVDLSKYGNHQAVDILSVDVSDWFMERLAAARRETPTMRRSRPS